MWMAATKHTAATRPWMGGRDGRAVHRARVRRHSRPPVQRAHTHRITRATAARARTSVKHWPLHAARMRASAGCRTASARSARRPPRAPDMRGDMGLGDPQPSSATPNDCARRSCVRTAAPAPATRADATRLIAHRRCGCAPHRVAARQTMRDLAGADWCFDRRRQTPNPNRIESARFCLFVLQCSLGFDFVCVCVRGRVRAASTHNRPNRRRRRRADRPSSTRRAACRAPRYVCAVAPAMHALAQRAERNWQLRATRRDACDAISHRQPARCSRASALWRRPENDRNERTNEPSHARASIAKLREIQN